jgi:excisionase family DNA binding protein
MNELLSLLDVCQRYGLSKWTIYQKTSKGLIPYLKIGGKILFRVKDLEKWEEMSAHTVKISLL